MPGPGAWCMAPRCRCASRSGSRWRSPCQLPAPTAKRARPSQAPVRLNPSHLCLHPHNFSAIQFQTTTQPRPNLCPTSRTSQLLLNYRRSNHGPTSVAEPLLSLSDLALASKLFRNPPILCSILFCVLTH